MKIGKYKKWLVGGTFAIIGITALGFGAGLIPSWVVGVLALGAAAVSFSGG